MPSPHALQILPPGAGPLSPDQKRFNQLIRQVDEAREQLRAWQEQIAAYRPVHATKMLPLRQDLLAAWKALVIALDDASLRHKWSRSEHETLSDLILEMLPALIERDDDPALKTVYERHAGIDYDEEQREELQVMQALAEAATGVDLGDKEIRDEDELLQHLFQGMADQAEAAAAQAAASRPAGRKRVSAAEKRKAEEARAATQSLREVYRKLASALHPDRENDPESRARKTALMQQVNQAYEKEDLLALLELQLRIEQIDADHLAGVDPARLKHYNRVLKEQLGELKAEIDAVRLGFVAEFELELRWNERPQDLARTTRIEAENLAAEVATARRQARLVDDLPAMKRWLKAERRRMRDADGPF